MSIPPVGREEILRALESFDADFRDADDWRDWEHKGNYDYAIQHENKRYPVKFVIELATGHPRGYFSGGSQANSYVEDRGFHVVRLRASGVESVWWVNQGQNYEREREEGYIYAGKIDRSGRTPYHWATLLEVQPDDVIVHYARGHIRALGRAESEAYEYVEPIGGSEPDHQDRQAGYRVDVSYFELSPPIPFGQVTAELTRLNIEQGPIMHAGGIKQGYLFRFTGVGLALIRQKHAGDWPSWARSSSSALDRANWEEFVHWASRFYGWEHFDATERDFKLDYASKVDRARREFLNGEPDWFMSLKRSLTGGAHPVTWRVSGQFKKWCEEHPDQARKALSIIWDSASDPIERVRSFLDTIPRSSVTSPSGRISLAAYLQSALDPTSLPVYRVSPFEKVFALTKYPTWPAGGDQADRFAHAVQFLDDFMSEAARRGVQIQDRLDAQGLVWIIAGWQLDWEPISEWSEQDREAFARYQSGKAPTTQEPSLETSVKPALSLAGLADKLLVSATHLEEIQQLLSDKRQMIFYGPPGTGKTYIAKALAEFFAMNPEDREEDGMVKIVQFHPSYAYEDFIEGYRPGRSADGAVGFELVEGPLREITRAAESQPDVTHVLIIDEINRGNVAKVLGELYFLLEYRDEAITLQYSSDEFSLPKNLWIIGTMNTADRSIALIDAALRRRFYFMPFFPDQPPIEGLLRRYLTRNKPDMLWVADVVDKANEQLGDRHGAIGPSYFMKDDLDEQWVERVWKHAVMPYLEEQFFGEEDRLDEFTLERLRGITPASDETADDAPSQPA